MKRAYRIEVLKDGLVVIPAGIARATYPAVAIKRVLDGGDAKGYLYASVGDRRVTLKGGEKLTVNVECLPEAWVAGR